MILLAANASVLECHATKHGSVCALTTGALVAALVLWFVLTALICLVGATVSSGNERTRRAEEKRVA